MRQPIAFIVAALAAMLLLVPAASAQSNSGADQYRQNVPNLGTEQPTESVDPGSGDGPSAPAPSGSVNSDTRDALSAEGGADGEKLADLADATAPQSASGNSKPAGGDEKAKDAKKGKGGKGKSRSNAAKSTKLSSSEPPVGETEAAQSSIGTGPGGLGGMLPILLAAGLIGAVAVRLLRRRADRRETDGLEG